MKQWIKITLGIIGGIVLLFVIDLICIFTINRPLFAIRSENNGMSYDVYKGIFYNVYNCAEYSTPQIKSKNSKFSCAVAKENIGKIKEIVDTTKDIKDFSCAEALDGFYEDENYTYYWSCLKNKYMIVIYESGFEETISNALKNGTIKISDLDRFNIDYIKNEKELGNNITSNLDFYITKPEAHNDIRFNDYYNVNNRIIYTAGYIGEFYIKHNKREITLKDYITKSDQSFDDSIKSITNNLTKTEMYRDGGTTVYKSKEKDITMIVCNTIDDNHDVFIGDYSMKFEQTMCK